MGNNDFIETKTMANNGHGGCQEIMIRKSQIQLVKRDKTTGYCWVCVGGKEYGIVTNYKDVVEQLKDIKNAK